MSSSFRRCCGPVALGVALMLLASPTIAVPTGDPSLSVFGITLGPGQWNVPIVQNAFGTFMGSQYCVVTQLAYVNGGGVQPDTAYFQFLGSNAATETFTIAGDASGTSGFAALQVALNKKPYNLNLIDLNVTAAYSSQTHSPASPEAGSWPAQHPEIIAGIAAGALVLVMALVICVIQRRSKRQERLRETMEAMMGDDDVRGIARGEAPTQVGGKKRAPAVSTAKAPRPNSGKKAPSGAPSKGSYAPPKAGQRARLVSFYTKHNPEKLSTVDATLAQYAGREEELFAALTTKYGPEPPTQPDGSNSIVNGGHQNGSIGEDGNVHSIEASKGSDSAAPPQQARSTSPEPSNGTTTAQGGDGPHDTEAAHSVNATEGTPGSGTENDTTAEKSS